MRPAPRADPFCLPHLSSQIATSLVLLAGAELLMRSLWNLRNQPLGMHTNSVVTASLGLGEQDYARPEQQMAFFLQLETRLRKLPGVNAVAFSDCCRLDGITTRSTLESELRESRCLPRGRAELSCGDG